MSRITVVTGANSGIGFATARALAARGDHVVLVCRREDAGRTATDAITEAGGSAELVLADLSDPVAIREAASTIVARHAAVDVLINNAGLYLPRRCETADGLEMTFAVNHLAAFRLTHLMLPSLERAPQGRVVVVSSRSHREGRLDWDDLQRARRRYWGYGAYADSKLCNLLFTAAMGRRLLGTTVTVNAVHPGIIATGFARDEPGFLHRLIRVGSLLMPGPEAGARGPVFLASEPRIDAVTGAYFSGSRLAVPSRRARSEEDAERLWRASAELSPGLPALD